MPRLYLIIPVDEIGGGGAGGPGIDNTLPGGPVHPWFPGHGPGWGGPVDPGWGGGRPPGPPSWGGGWGGGPRPGHDLPWAPVRPGWPAPPGIWPNPPGGGPPSWGGGWGGGPRPDNALPGGGAHPWFPGHLGGGEHPSHPIYFPKPGIDNTLPENPPEAPPIIVWIPGIGWVEATPGVPPKPVPAPPEAQPK